MSAKGQVRELDVFIFGLIDQGLFVGSVVII
jgi:hypothetical protein